MASLFLTVLSATKVLSPVPGANPLSYTLTAPLKFKSDLSKETFTVPAGYVAYFAQVPKKTYFGPGWERALVLYDYLRNGKMLPKFKAADILYEALIADGVPGLKAGVFWAYVKVFGK